MGYSSSAAYGGGSGYSSCGESGYDDRQTGYGGGGRAYGASGGAKATGRRGGRQRKKRRRRRRGGYSRSSPLTVSQWFCTQAGVCDSFGLGLLWLLLRMLFIFGLLTLAVWPLKLMFEDQTLGGLPNVDVLLPIVFALYFLSEMMLVVTEATRSRDRVDLMTAMTKSVKSNLLRPERSLVWSLLGGLVFGVGWAVALWYDVQDYAEHREFVMITCLVGGFLVFVSRFHFGAMAGWITFMCSAYGLWARQIGKNINKGTFSAYRAMGEYERLMDSVQKFNSLLRWQLLQIFVSLAVAFLAANLGTAGTYWSPFWWWFAVINSVYGFRVIGYAATYSHHTKKMLDAAAIMIRKSASRRAFENDTLHDWDKFVLMAQTRGTAIVVSGVPITKPLAVAAGFAYVIGLVFTLRFVFAGEVTLAGSV